MGFIILQQQILEVNMMSTNFLDPIIYNLLIPKGDLLVLKELGNIKILNRTPIISLYNFCYKIINMYMFSFFSFVDLFWL